MDALADDTSGAFGHSLLPAGDVGARTFEDSVGTVWEVFEVHRASEAPHSVSAGMEKGWLAFVCAGEKRRLAPFPSTWETVTLLELEQLCAAARRANPTRLPFVAQESRRIRSVGVRATVVDPSPETVVRDVVRAFALDARATRVPAIEAMVRLKTMLSERFKGDDIAAATRADAEDLRRVRRWFVEAYYFERTE